MTIEAPHAASDLIPGATAGRRAALIVAWGAVALIVLAVVLRETTSGATLQVIDVANTLLLSAAFTLVGGAISARRPGNAFGRVALATGAIGAAAGAAGSAPRPEPV